MRVVIDTDVLVSSFFGGKPRKIIELWKTEQITLCLTKEILDEYVEVLQRMGIQGTMLKELLSFFASGFNLLYTGKTPSIQVVENDPDDDKFIECAIALKAKAIITGDKALKAVREYDWIKIMAPQEFLKQYDMR